LINY